MERRLAAILAADVAGYSSLIHADEAGTIARVKMHIVESFEPRILAHHGHIVKTTGDGVLAEFQSVVEALLCAVEIQQNMMQRNSYEPEGLCVRFRMGINIGDVVVDNGDIFGDGVNIATRLEGLAEPGGICVHRDVRSQVGNRVPLRFEDMGDVAVKNFAHPLSVYRVVVNPLRSAATAPMPMARRKAPKRTAVSLVAAALAIGVLVPLGSELVDISPPWPRGVLAFTSILGLAAFLVSYRVFEEMPPRRVNRGVGYTALTFGVLALLYAMLSGLLFYETPDGQRFVRGLVCTQDAGLVYGSNCPLLSEAFIAEAQYDPEAFWTPVSIMWARGLLLLLWAGVVVFLACSIGAALTHLPSTTPEHPKSGEA